MTNTKFEILLLETYRNRNRYLTWQYLKKMEASNFQMNESIKPSLKIMPWLSITQWAASLLILISASTIWYLYTSSQGDRYFDQYYSIPSQTYITRSGNTVMAQDKLQAFFLLNQGEYQKAMDKFAMLHSKNPNDSLLFYQAICQIELHQYLIADELLENLVLYHPSNHEYRWYYSLLLTKDHRWDVVQKHLAILSQSNYFRANDAKTLLLKIKK